MSDIIQTLISDINRYRYMSLFASKIIVNILGPYKRFQQIWRYPGIVLTVLMYHMYSIWYSSDQVLMYHMYIEFVFTLSWHLLVSSFLSPILRRSTGAETSQYPSALGAVAMEKKPLRGKGVAAQEFRTLVNSDLQNLKKDEALSDRFTKFKGLVLILL